MKIQKKIFNGFFQFGMLKYIIKWKIWIEGQHHLVKLDISVQTTI